MERTKKEEEYRKFYILLPTRVRKNIKHVAFRARYTNKDEAICILAAPIDKEDIKKQLRRSLEGLGGKQIVFFIVVFSEKIQITAKSILFYTAFSGDALLMEKYYTIFSI